MAANSELLVYYHPQRQRICVLIKLDDGVTVETHQTVREARELVLALQRSIEDGEKAGAS
jgi:hypothetical protein